MNARNKIHRRRLRYAGIITVQRSKNAPSALKKLIPDFVCDVVALARGGLTT
jgi:hypothetical protein